MRPHMKWFLAAALAASAALVLIVSGTTAEARQTCGQTPSNQTLFGGSNYCITPTRGWWEIGSIGTVNGAVPMFWMQEQATVNASFSLPASNGVIVQHCNNRLVFTFNDAGTTRYFYLALNSDSGTWTQTTTSPC